MTEEQINKFYEDFRNNLKVPLYTVTDRIRLDSGETATVFSVMPAAWYKNTIGPTYDYTQWYLIDEHWLDKNIYYVLLDNPARPVSFEQFAEKHVEIKEEKLYEEYERQFPKVRILSVVENAIVGGA